MLPLQAVGRRGRSARLLDDDRGSVDRRSVRRSAGGVGAAARDRRGVRSAADLRVAPLDHVFEEGLLLLRAAEGEVSRAVDHARPADQGAAGAKRHERVDEEIRESDPHHAPRRSRATDHRLDARSVREARRVAGKGLDEKTRQSAEGFSAASITSTSTAPRWASSLSPSCSCSAVKSDGPSASNCAIGIGPRPPPGI